jgi:2-haloacid dehalogenase
MSGYDVVLFDADDTLFDFRRAEAHALAEAFRERSLKLGPEEAAAYHEINKGLWRRLELGEIVQAQIRSERFRLLFERMGIAEDPVAIGELYVRRLGQAGFLLEGAEALCARLSRGRRLAILTNGISDVQRSRFAASPLGPYFERILVSEDIGASKPDPVIFERACELMGIRDKASVLMVGDALATDMLGAIRFGIDSCWFNPNGAAPDPAIRPTYTARSFEDVARAAEVEPGGEAL